MFGSGRIDMYGRGRTKNTKKKKPALSSFVLDVLSHLTSSTIRVNGFVQKTMCVLLVPLMQVEIHGLHIFERT